jgi:beta-glucosidase
MEGHTYRYFRGTPLYPFGYGLSYTTIAYSDLALSASTLPAGEALQASVTVRNSGARAGDEVVQVYLRDLAASVPVPIRQLVGFQRVHLGPGASATLSFSITPRQMSLLDAQGQRVIEPGAFALSVGGGQPGSEGAQTLTAEFVLSGAVKAL